MRRNVFVGVTAVTVIVAVAMTMCAVIVTATTSKQGQARDNCRDREKCLQLHVPKQTEIRGCVEPSREQHGLLGAP